MEIVRKEIDVAGKYRVLVCYDGVNCLSLKFQEEISDIDVLQIAQDTLARRQQEEQEIAYLAQLLEEQRMLLEELGNENNQEGK